MANLSEIMPGEFALMRELARRTCTWLIRLAIYYGSIVSGAILYRVARVAIETPYWILMVISNIADRVLVFTCNVAMYPIDMLVYMVTPIEPPPPPPTIGEKIVGYVGLVQNWFDFVPWLDLLLPTAVFLVVLLCGLCLRRVCIRTVMRVRGVYIGEAMRNGSNFVSGKNPPGQVSIMVPGLLVDSHVGYGLRVGNVLVAPAHVMVNLLNPIIAYNGRKVMVSLDNRVMSRVMPDIVYIMLEEVTWTRIGVPKVRTMSRTPKVATSVSCTGMSGMSVGLLRKSTKMGLMVYTGSTIPGMSGAGYFVNDHCHGIHNGVMGSENVGVAIALILKELRVVFRGETTVFVEEEYEKNRPEVARKLKTWDDLAIDSSVKNVWGDLDEEADADYWDDLDRRFAGESVPKLVKLSDESHVKLRGQGLEETEAVYRSTVAVAGMDALEARVRNLEKLVVSVGFQSCPDCDGVFVGTTLENHAKTHRRHVCTKCSQVVDSEEALAAHVKKHVRYPCDRCPMVCNTEKKLENHRKDCRVTGAAAVEVKPAKGAALVGESAYPMDFRKAVKTGPFLGDRTRSRRKNGRKSPNTSPPRASSKSSPSQEEILSKILESQLSMQKSFEKLLHRSDGQSLATRPN